MHLIIALWLRFLGGESVLNQVARTLLTELRSVARFGISVNSNHYVVNLEVGADLKSLWQMMAISKPWKTPDSEFCPYCRCQKHQAALSVHPSHSEEWETLYAFFLYFCFLIRFPAPFIDALHTTNSLG